jgi:acid stress-induced BolA-like protein IbaG/YrbA
MRYLRGVDVGVLVAAGMGIVSIAAGAGAIAGAEVSAIVVSSFFAHATNTRTAATRARRFIYDLLKRLRGINRRSVHAVAVPVFGADENLSHQELVSRVELSSCPLAHGVHYLLESRFPPEI